MKRFASIFLGLSTLTLNSQLVNQSFNNSTEFANNQKTLPKEVKKQIDFSTKSLEVFLKKNKIKAKFFNFRNILKFKNQIDLLKFYRSTVFYHKKSEKNLSNYFNLNYKKKRYLNIIKSAKLYKFRLK